MCGINAKQSELHATLGLSIFPYLSEIIKKRKKISELYDYYLLDFLKKPLMQEHLEYNYSYYPVLFSSEKELLNVFYALNKENIYPRRYFFPSLNTLSYIKNYQFCPVSEDISKRIACLPLYVGLAQKQIKKICKIIIRTLKNE